MRFDPTTPLAVFLGPSLALDEARARLRANYYPPVRMGDVYRLLATGVRRIAIIDGVFHHSTPVWQRELLAALDEGIEVLGGASMGALRAAELSSFGMHGIGTVYGWYRDGVIEGDDEVALLHTDADMGYRALSEPLVNLRYNLQRACDEQIIDRAQRDALLQQLQSRCFSERSWRAVFDAAAELGLPASHCAALREFVETRVVDVKRADALAVLAACAAPVNSVAVRASQRWSYPGDAVRPLLQSACTDDGELVAGETVLHAALDDASGLATRERALRRRFFLLAAFDELADDAARAAVLTTPNRGPEPDANALRRSGLTRAEFARERAERACLTWLAAAPPPAAPAGVAPAALGDVEAVSQENAWIAAWASRVGIEAPDDPLAGGLHALTAARAPCAVVDWLIDRGPHFFGYTAWNAQGVLLRSLRFDALGHAEPADVLTR